MKKFSGDSAIRNPKSAMSFLATFYLLLATFTFAQINWGPDVRLTYYVRGISFHPKIALSGDTIHIVWYEDWVDTVEYIEVIYKRSTDRGETWTQDTILSSLAPGASQVPDIAVSGSVVHVVWTEEVGDSVVYIRSSDGGRTWMAPITMTQTGGNPHVGAYGNFVFVEWGRVGGTFYRLSYDGGESWTPEMQIPRPSRLGDKKVQIVNSYIHLAPDGYPTDTSVIIEIFHQYSSDCGQTWSTPVMISEQDDWAGQHPAIAVNCDSNVYIDWYDYKNSPYPWTGSIFARKGIDNGTLWDTIQNITTLYRAKRPDIAVFNDNVHIVWMDQRDYPGSPFDSFEIYYRYSSDGGNTWGPETRLTFDPNDSETPRIAADSHSVFLVWADNRDLDSIWRSYEVYFKRGDYDQSSVHKGAKETSCLSFDIIPNPASGFVRFLFADLQDWVIDVFDVAGRKVWSSKGYGKEVVWNGIDRNGDRVSAGVYFVKIRTKEKVGLSKIVLLNER